MMLLNIQQIISFHKATKASSDSETQNRFPGYSDSTLDPYVYLHFIRFVI